MTTIDDARAAQLNYPPAELDRASLLRLYEQMSLLRRFELKAQELYKQGQWPGFIHLYVGEEATAVGVCAHLTREDWITSTHRGHGHALAKGVPPRVVMAELFGKATGCCGGRGGSMHLYAPEYGLFGTNGLVGGGIPSAVGVGISAKARGTNQLGVSFFGDGAVNHGAFHESLNFAGVQRAPVVFVCENNLYATATPLAMATLNTDVASKAAAYGILGVAVDGNDVIAVWEAMRHAVERARAGFGPTLIEARTYRTVGHHEGDPVIGVYRSREEVEAWKLRCPIAMLRRRLVDEWRIAGNDDLAGIDAEIDATVLEAVEFARSSPFPDPRTLHQHVLAEPPDPPLEALSGETATQGWLDAVRDGIAEEMRRDPSLVYLGEGTGERGGSFAHTKNLWHEFGAERMIDTPISELGFTGAAVGAAATGCRAIADLMFVDFLFDAASQVAHQAAKLRYMSGGKIAVPMVIRASCGAIKNAGAHHSGSFYPMWAHIPGLIVVVPSTPADAKGLMKTALRSGDPVLFLEHKSLFATKGEVPQGDRLVPFGQARIARQGRNLTIISCGLLAHRSVEAAEQLAAEGIDCEVIDLRTIVPLDVETIAASIAKTGRALVVDEAYSMCGLGGEIAATVMERAFDDLDAPVGRLHTEAVTHPFSPAFDEATLVTVDKIVAAAREVIAGRAPVQQRPWPASRADRPGQAEPGSGSRPPLSPAAPKHDEPTRAASGNEIPITMPHGDLTVSEARVVAWLKREGDRVAQGETVVELETDKGITEVESPASGVLAAIVAPADTVVEHGARLGLVRPD